MTDKIPSLNRKPSPVEQRDYKLSAFLPKMTLEEAEEWAIEMCEGGTYDARKDYLIKFGAGQIAKDMWHDPLFTYGMEYGILIAVKKIFGELD